MLVCRPGGLKQASQRCGCKGLEDHAWGKTFYKWEMSVAPPGPLSELCLLFHCGIHNLRMKSMDYVPEYEEGYRE